MSDTKIKTSNIGNLAVTHALLHTDMDLTSKTVQVATPTSNTHPATKLYVDTEVANLIDSAPGTLDTLNELAAAINDDANFNATIASSIATKLPLAGGTLTGNLTLASTASGSSASPELELRRDITGVDANYIGQIKFTADNDADQNIVFAKITGKILDASDGTEDGILEITHKKAGSNNISARFRSDSLQLINGTNLTVAGTTELTGNLTVDTSTLHVDTSNNRVGIGTTSPSEKLEVAGNISIGTSSQWIGRDSENNSFGFDASYGQFINSTASISLAIDSNNGDSDTRYFRILKNAYGYGSGTELFRVNENGHFGIGTTSPAGLQSWAKGTRILDLKLETTPATGDVGVQFRANTGAYLGLAAGGGTGIGIVIDSNNNVGIGRTPQSHYTGYTALDLGHSSSLFGNKTGSDTNVVTLANNGYLNSTASAWKYIVTDEATKYEQSSGKHRWFHASSGTAGTDVTWTNSLTIDESGNVGIGDATPSYKLTVGGGHIVLKQDTAATDGTGDTQRQSIGWHTAGAETVIGAYITSATQGSWGGDLRFNTRGSGGGTSHTRMMITDGGDVGIGTTSPGHRLDVDGGSIRIQDVGQFIYFGTDASVKIGTVSGNSNDLYLGSADDLNIESNFIRLWRDGYYGSTEYSRIAFSDYSWLCNGSGSHKLGIGTTNPSEKLHVSGNILATGNITANSDISLKDNITPIPNALDKVLQIRGVTFNRNDIEDNPRHAGVIAQEVEKVLPEVVSEGEDGIKSVAYGNMVSLLIEAIKEQQEQIDELKKMLEVK